MLNLLALTVVPGAEWLNGEGAEGTSAGFKNGLSSRTWLRPAGLGGHWKAAQQPRLLEPVVSRKNRGIWVTW